MNQIPGINIQWPWSELILSGKKTIETRSYPLPAKYIGVRLAVIETPGLSGRGKAKIVGTVIFDNSFQYKSESHWSRDCVKHLVDNKDANFSWKAKRAQIWGWRVLNVTRLRTPVPPPQKRGIVFARECSI